MGEGYGGEEGTLRTTVMPGILRGHKDAAVSWARLRPLEGGVWLLTVRYFSYNHRYICLLLMSCIFSPPFLLSSSLGCPYPGVCPSRTPVSI